MAQVGTEAPRLPTRVQSSRQASVMGGAAQYFSTSSGDRTCSPAQLVTHPP